MRHGTHRALAPVLALVPFGGRTEAQMNSTAAAGIEFERCSFATAEAIDIESLSLLTVGSALVQPSVDLRVGDSDAQPGYTVDVGAPPEAPAGRSTLIPSARFRLDNVESIDGITSSYTGLDPGLTVPLGAVNK